MSEDPGRRYRESLHSRLTALKNARPGVAEDDPEATESVRRIGHVLKGSGASFGYPGVTEVGGALEKADDDEVLERLDACVDHLERVLAEAEGEPDAGAVLVVEDEPTQALLMRTILERDGHRVLVAESGAEAERLVSGERLRAIVLDLILPDTDGRKFLMGLRERTETAEIPVIVVTAKATALTRSECLTLGADAVFEKPVDPEALQATVSARVRRAAEVEREASLDRLTGLLNRAGFAAAFRDRCGEGTLALIEIDGFDSIRKRIGRSGVDAVLARIGRVLDDAVDVPLPVSRLEGPTFAVYLPGCDAREASGRIELLLERIREAEVRDPEGEPFRVTAAAGVADAPPDCDLAEAVDRAQGRLLTAQEGGGNRLASAADEPEADREERTVLLAEDDELTAGLLRHRLEREGFRVLHYEDGLEAYEGAVERTVSLAILDVQMPGMGGFELLERLRKTPAYAEVPVLILTAMGSEEDLERGFALGADDYMLKPFSPTELLARVRRLLTRSVSGPE